MYPVAPYRVEENGTQVFTNLQIDLYGLPDYYGINNYIIVENSSTGYYVPDYKMEQDYYRRPIHRYSRKQRFENTVQELLGLKGSVPSYVIEIIKIYVDPEKDLWNGVRKILKHFKLRIYYNRIPFIIYKCFGKKSVVWPDKDFYKDVMDAYKRISYLFEQGKHNLNRKYFPNMRFIALKLMGALGGEFQYPIPLTRTQRKRKDLEFIWNTFVITV